MTKPHTTKQPTNGSETSQAGEALYNLIGFLKKAYNQYAAGTEKERLKDALTFGALISFLLFAVWIVNSEYSHAQKYTIYPNGVKVYHAAVEYPNGSKIYGDANLIEKIKSDMGLPGIPRLKRVEEITTSTSTTITSTTHTPTTSITCPPPKECICRPCTCPVCSRCPQPRECVENEVVIDIISRLRPTAESPAYQNGFYDMRKNCLQALGGNVSRFREGPSHTNWKLLSGIQNYVGEPGDTYCFRRDGFSFTLNRSLWGWNDDKCKTSSLVVTRLLT